MRVRVGADHGGFEMKQELATLLARDGHEVVDFGDKKFDSSDDYPDFATPLGRALASGEVERRSHNPIVTKEFSNEHSPRRTLGHGWNTD